MAARGGQSVMAVASGGLVSKPQVAPRVKAILGAD